jgi:hypothetical protein
MFGSFLPSLGLVLTSTKSTQVMGGDIVLESTKDGCQVPGALSPQKFNYVSCSLLDPERVLLIVPHCEREAKDLLIAQIVRRRR